MALYHFHADVVSRSHNSSVVASAAYRAGEKLHSDYYREDADYTRKGGVLLTEIFLPPNAPTAYQDRETLWNAVEKAEKHPKAQLAYSYDFALQNELTMEENIALARRFVKEQFLSKGMIVDFAVHAPDKKDGGIPNPHVHLLCPIRPLKEDGTWEAKQHRVYRLDENGERIRDKNGKYVFDAVPTTDWGQKEALLHWREEWANYVNQAFEKKGLPCRIDHRTLAEQGADHLPTIHEGPAVRAMEARGISTNRGDFNRWIKATESAIRSLREKLKGLLSWIKEVRVELAALREQDLQGLLSDYYQKRISGAYSVKAISNNAIKFESAVDYLVKRNLSTIDDLDRYASDLNRKMLRMGAERRAKAERIKELDRLLQRASDYQKYKPLIEKLNSIKFKKRRENFKNEHDRELTLYYLAERELKHHFTKDGKLPLSAWRNEKAQLVQEQQAVNARYSGIYHEVGELNNIRYCVEQAKRQREQARTKQIDNRRDSRQDHSRI